MKTYKYTAYSNIQDGRRSYAFYIEGKGSAMHTTVMRVSENNGPYELDDAYGMDGLLDILASYSDNSNVAFFKDGCFRGMMDIVTSEDFRTKLYCTSLKLSEIYIYPE